MARSQATLSAELQAIVPTLGSGSMALAQAYGNYMADAEALTPIIQAALPAAVTAMAGAMTFTAGATAAAGAAVIQGGLVAFWAAMNAPASAYFASATLVVTPGQIFSVTPLITAALAANTAPGTTVVQACDALAAVIHTASNGGTTTTPPSVVTVIL